MKTINGSKQSKLSTAQTWVKINLVLLLACCLSPCGSGRAGQWAAHQFNQSSPETQSSVPHNWSQTPREGHRPRARPGFACPSGSQRTSRTSTLHYTYGVYTVHAFTVLFSCAPYLVQTRRTGYLTQLRTYYSVRSGRRYP
ncbi:hypothetical protein HDV62DRAFT_31436 [Trichoderma sp. SZMC 28011]